MNPYIIPFLVACVVYIIIFSKLNNTEDNPSWFHKETAMYSTGAGAVGFAIVYFINSRKNEISTYTEIVSPGDAILTNRPSVTTNTKQNLVPNSTVGSTGELVMKGPFQ